MSKYRNNLPQLSGKPFITDAGMETELVFHDGIDLPYFASFDLLRSADGTAHLRAYYEKFADIARRHGKGLILESATWRASKDWGERMGLSDAALAGINRDAISVLAELRFERETLGTPIVVSGCIGPRGDGYDPGTAMTVEEARDYHSRQIAVFADTEADLVTAMTMTNSAEALGLTLAAKDAGMPVVISFTVETDGRLPTGEALGEAIMRVDRESGDYPAYFMINCAHPSHFDTVLAGNQPWLRRIRGLRANASKRSHAELDDAPDLDEGNPVELGLEKAALSRRLPQLSILGGCCGTDHRHIEEICMAMDRVAAE